jgi:hypothetical protein
VQYADEFYRVALYACAVLVEQFAYGLVDGAPDGGGAYLLQVFVEEEPCAFVGEYDCYVGETVPYSL